jgi:hypothetical protein
MFWMLANNLNDLYGATGSFNLGLGRLAELVSFDSQGFGQFSITENLDTILEITDQTGFAKGFKVNNATGIEKFKVTQVNQGINRTGQRSKAAFGQTALQGHLTTLKAWLDATTGASILTFMAFTGRFTLAGTLATTDTLFTMS